MKKLRYRLHWASSDRPRPEFKWVVYDWKYFCPVAYSETRVGGRRLSEFLNAEALILTDSRISK
jgi:hypothetical protein